MAILTGKDIKHRMDVIDERPRRVLFYDGQFCWLLKPVDLSEIEALPDEYGMRPRFWADDNGRLVLWPKLMH